MRIAFFGLPLAGCLLAADGHEIVFAGLSRRGSPGTRRLRRLLGEDRVRIVPKVDDPAVVRAVAAAAPDLLVSWFWTTKLTPRILSLPPLGAFGVHPSLLPRHRGPDPYFWTILHGDTVSGVSAHRIASEYDTGALLGQRTLPVDPGWNALQLARALDRPSLALLRETVRAFAAGAPPPDVSQDETLATLAPEPGDADLEIDWTTSVDDVLRRIRAAAPFPGAYTFVGDRQIAVARARRAESRLAALEPGEAAAWQGRLLVRAADGAVIIEQARDDEDQPLSPAELALLAEPTPAT
jgi:methionyl-tRNA formyltransferase